MPTFSVAPLARLPAPTTKRSFGASRSTPRRRRTRLADRLLLIGCALILAKCAGTFWLIDYYDVPFNGWWIAAPSLAAALACSCIYLYRR